MTLDDLDDAAPRVAAATDIRAADAPGSSDLRSCAPKLGRKRDHSRDPEILDAALDVLAETGYDGMTIDMVAARARAGKATLYRRWPSKGHLVIDAIACMKRVDLPNDELPDTGSLRGDLVSLIKQPSIQDSERKLKIMAGLLSMMSKDPGLAVVAKTQILEPHVTIIRALLLRAIERGEIRADCDIESLSTLSTAMTSYRLLILNKPVTREFLISLIDGVLLPSAALRETGTLPAR
ncbi:TetR/AcrR family transcriptional regulator [soil metagenome]